MKLTKENVFPIIISALKEDIASGDTTSTILFDKYMEVMANIIIKEDALVSGIDIARWVFNAVDEKIYFKPFYKDGDIVKKGKKVIAIKGCAANILAGERTALNFLGRLSGISTLVSKFTAKVRTTDAKIFDTRKTAPGLRELEKYAVRAGGGYNYRIGLWDGILIKDNHLESLAIKTNSSKSAVIKKAVSIFKEKGYKHIEIEVDNLLEFREAMEAGAGIIMLDNMKVEDIKKAVKLRNSKLKAGSPGILLDVSGGVTLENAASIAKTGVDRISIGSLTHSAPSIDFSLEICR